jgi:hypothetical protein
MVRTTANQPTRMRLLPGTSYAKGWKEANDAADRLATALVAVGLADQFAYLKADVNVFGVGLVSLGTVTPETARALAELLDAASREVAEGRPQIRGPDTDEGTAA